MSASTARAELSDVQTVPLPPFHPWEVPQKPVSVRPFYHGRAAICVHAQLFKDAVLLKSRELHAKNPTNQSRKFL